jgi:hypothetical protein
MARKPRDYQEEYQRRVARGFGGGAKKKQPRRRGDPAYWEPFGRPDDADDDDPFDVVDDFIDYPISEYRRIRNENATRRTANQEANTAISRERLAANVRFREAVDEVKRIAIAQRDASQREAREERTARNEANIAERQRAQAVREARAEQNRLDAERRRQERAAAQDAPTYRGAQAPSFTTGTTGVGGGPNKEAVAKFIILATALGALGALAQSVNGSKPPLVLPDGTKVPAHLASLGGAFIAGTVALIVNEVYPGAGLVLGAGIVVLVVIPNWTPLLSQLGTLGGGASPFKGTNPSVNTNTPEGRQALAFIHAHPGKAPFPGAKPGSTQAWWNTYAANTFANSQHPG